MAKKKVSIISPIRRALPWLNCMSPVHAREIEEKTLVPIIRAGFVVVDAADPTKVIGLDPTGEAIKVFEPKKPTAQAAQAPSGSPQGGVAPQGGGGPKGPGQN